MNATKPEKLAIVKKLLLQGLSNNAVCRMARVSGGTIAGLRRRLAPNAKCPCGKLGNHKGWCRARLGNSPARQMFLADWNPKAPNPSGLCQCGCGGMTTKAKHDEPSTGIAAGEHHRFLHNHYHNLMRQYEATWGRHSQRLRAREARHADAQFYIALEEIRAEGRAKERERAKWLQFAYETHREQRRFMIVRDRLMAQQNKVHREAVKEHRLQAKRERRQRQWAILTVIEMEKVRARKARRAGNRRAFAMTKKTSHVFRYLAALSAITNEKN